MLQVIIYRRTLMSNNLELPTQSAYIEEGPDVMQTPPKKPAQVDMFMSREIQIKDLKSSTAQKDKQLKAQSIEVDLLKEQLQELQISSFKAQRERDLLKLRLEKLQALCEENGIVVQEDDGEEVEREKLADEYAHRLEQLQNDVEQKKKTIRTLRDENEALENSSRRDTELLEKKSAEIEKLKKTLTRVQKESMKRAAEPENGRRQSARSGGASRTARRSRAQSKRVAKRTSRATGCPRNSTTRSKTPMTCLSTTWPFP